VSDAVAVNPLIPNITDLGAEPFIIFFKPPTIEEKLAGANMLLYWPPITEEKYAPAVFPEPAPIIE